MLGKDDPAGVPYDPESAAAASSTWEDSVATRRCPRTRYWFYRNTLGLMTRHIGSADFEKGGKTLMRRSTRTASTRTLTEKTQAARPQPAC